MDFALISQAATLRSRIPFVHFFDGFRTSHEVSKIEMLTEADLRAMIDDRLIAAHRSRAMTPDRPVLRGTAQNPDVVFPGPRSVQSFLRACPHIVQKVMDEFAAQVGRAYKLFEYVGAPDAERVIVLMGSGCETAHETVEYLNRQGEKVGIAQSAAVPAVRLQALRRGAARDGQVHCRARPHQGTRRGRRTALPGLHRGRVRRIDERLGPDQYACRECSAAATGCPRRNSPRHGQGRVRQSRNSRSRRIISPSASTTTSPTRACRWIARVLDRVGQGGSRAVLRSGRGRHGRRQQELHQDHRRRTRRITPRVISFTTRRNPAA